jgi:outer membrane protein insertion porin family
MLGKNINGVIFHDLGNIYSDLGSISLRTKQKDMTDFNYMVHAVGFGVRYKTPVGPVRVDLSYSVNPPVFNGLKGTYRVDAPACLPYGALQAKFAASLVLPVPL